MGYFPYHIIFDSTLVWPKVAENRSVLSTIPLTQGLSPNVASCALHPKMRNLRNISHSVDRESSPLASASASLCWDATYDDVLVAHGPSADEPRIELKRVSKNPACPSGL